MSTSHPSDEELSAHLDGEAPEVGAHVATCAACRSRLDDLRRAAALVGAPPPPAAEWARDDAIARALADRGGDARRRRLTLFAAAAAVVVASGIATPLLLRGGEHRTTTALSQSKGTSDQARFGAEAGSTAVAPLVASDLGDQSDPDALSRLVSAAITPNGKAEAAGGGSSAGAVAGSAPSPSPQSTIACTAPVDGAQVVYQATLRWKGTPAQLFAIEPGRRLVVMDSARCQVLVDRHF